MTAQQVSDAIDPILTALGALKDDTDALVALNESLTGEPLCHHPQIAHADTRAAVEAASAAITDISDTLTQLQTDVLA